MPVYNAQKLDVLRQLMLDKAQAEKQAMLLELEQNRSARLEKVKDQALQDAYQIIQEKSGDLNVQTVSALSREGMELRKKLMEKRDAYAASLFDEVKERLKAFAAGKQYQEYLEHALKKAAASGMFALSGGEALLRVNSRDLTLCEEIKEAFGLPCRIEADENIEIGGFVAENTERGLALDGTLDRRLEEQKEWFYRNSGFLVDVSF